MDVALAAIVLSHNDAGRIGPCLSSVAGLVDRTFVVDSGSTDETEAIAVAHGAQVVRHAFRGYAQQRNWALNNLPLDGGWVFHVDADERVDSELAEWLRTARRTVFHDADVAGVLVRRRIVFMGKEIRHGGINPTFHCRAFRIGTGRCEERLYDQHFVVDGGLATANGSLIEDNGFDIVSWCDKHLRWATLEAAELKGGRSGVVGDGARDRLQARLSGNPLERRRWLRERLYGRLPKLWRPWILFGYRIFLRFGFLDGWRGVTYHLLHTLWFRSVVDVLTLLPEEGASRVTAAEARMAPGLGEGE